MPVMSQTGTGFKELTPGAIPACWWWNELSLVGHVEGSSTGEHALPMIESARPVPS